MPDHAAGRIGDRKHKLFGEMIGERGFSRHERFQIVVAVRISAATSAVPLRVGRRLRGARVRGGLAGVVGEYVFKVGAEPVLDRGAADFEVAVDPVAGLALILDGGWGFGLLFGGSRLALAGAFEQGVAFELPFHVSGQIQVRELQQLDGLHQLRRHHERLALAHFKSRRQCHGCTRVGPVLAYPFRDKLYTDLLWQSLMGLSRGNRPGIGWELAARGGIPRPDRAAGHRGCSRCPQCGPP